MPLKRHFNTTLMVSKLGAFGQAYNAYIQAYCTRDAVIITKRSFCSAEEPQPSSKTARSTAIRMLKLAPQAVQ